MELLWKVLIRVLIPFVIQQLIHSCQHHLSIWAPIAAALPSLAELAEFAAQAGIASIVADEVIKHSLVPPLLLAMKDGMRSIADAVAKSIHDTPLVLRHDIPTPVPEPAVAARELSADPKLAEAKQLFENQQFDEAIVLLKELAREDAKYDIDLLNVLVYSEHIADWDAARALLPKLGEPRHYTRLAIKYWNRDAFDAAIEITEEALRVAEKGGNKLDIARVRNNLAYFYADAGREDKANVARRLATDAYRAVEALRKEKLVDQAAKGLVIATRGYVKIVFAESLDDIADGLKDCERGKNWGARLDLYYKHVRRAQEKTLEIQRLRSR